MTTSETNPGTDNKGAEHKLWHAPKVATLNSITENTLGGMGPSPDAGATTVPS